MAPSAWDGIATYLGLRPLDLDRVVLPRTAIERIGNAGPDSTPVELVIGIAFLAILLAAWVMIALSDTNLAIRLLCVLAIVFDVAMIVARVQYLLRPR